MNLLRAALAWLLEKHVKEENTTMSKIVLSLAVLAGVFANGTTANTLSIQVTDDAGAPLAGQAVTLAGDAGVSLSAASVTTDATGAATVDLTSTQPGTYQVTATLEDGTTQSVSVVFLDVPVVIPATPLAEAKAGVQDFEKAFQFVADGVSKLGGAAESELIALAKKYL